MGGLSFSARPSRQTSSAKIEAVENQEKSNQYEEPAYDRNSGKATSHGMIEMDP